MVVVVGGASSGIGRTCPKRRAIHSLVVLAILMFFTIIAGLAFGTNLFDRVTVALEVIEGEVVTSSAVHRDGVLHVRSNFKHVLGTGFDRVAVSEVVVGEMLVVRVGGGLESDHAGLEYDAVEGTWTDGTITQDCATWAVVSNPSWPPAWPPPLPTTPCEMHVYQRIDDNDLRPDALALSEGNTAVLEFVMVGVAEPPSVPVGVAVEFGTADNTEITGTADTTLFLTP